ncbi:MAG: SCP2 sterol-binding domain-containing protein [Hahellaceae bacterium]|nr:SCP2 sterol-binding domain-containing protein [Hahellaceae bacterium]
MLSILPALPPIGTLIPWANMPKLFAAPLSKLPFQAQKLGLTRVLRQVLEEAMAMGDCDFLRNKWLEVRIDDLNIQWFFSLNDTRQIVMRAHAPADVCISGNLNEFILLAARKEDPDTLFFNRRLLIEGDTELGLATKNLIDSLDLASLPPELRFLVRSAGEYVEIFCQ